MNEQIVNVCVVCGAMKDIETEKGKTAAAFPSLPGATVEPVGNSTLPRGQLTVHGQEMPFDGALYALTIAFEYAGQSAELSGPVRVSVPLQNERAFKLFRMDKGVLTELQYTYENDILSYEIDQAGMFLLIAAE